MTASRPPAQALTEDEAQVVARFEAAEAAPESFRPLPGEIAMHRAMNATPEQAAALQEIAATMTASRVPLGVLDDLEAALEASKPGPWRVSANGEDVVSPTHGVVADAYEPADAAAIVAAVNLAPKLLAAVRAVAELCEAADEKVRGSVPASAADRLIADGTHTVYVGKVRAALSSSLGAEGDHRG